MLRPNLSLIAVLTLTISFNSYAQSGVTPFKLGSFEENGRGFVGIVLDGDTVIDIASADTQLPRQGSAVAPPVDMKDLISRYQDGLRARIIEIINGVSAAGVNSRPAYVHSLDEIEIMPPVMYPRTIMNTALNYTEHALEMEDIREDGVDAEPGIATAGDSRPGGVWEPGGSDRRWNPYISPLRRSSPMARPYRYLSTGPRSTGNANWGWSSRGRQVTFRCRKLRITSSVTRWNWMSPTGRTVGTPATDPTG